MSAEGYQFTLQTAVRFFTVECYKCGVVFAVDETLQSNWRRDKTQFFCPNGHGQSYTESEADRLKRQLQVAQRELEFQIQRAKTTEKKLASTRGAMMRLKRRANHGVCPHCQRTVSQMARHIATKHPEQLEVK